MAKKTKTNLSPVTVIAEGKDEWGRRYFLFGAGEDPIANFPPVLASRLITKQKEVFGELANAGFGLYTSSEQRLFIESVQKWERGNNVPSFKVATKIGWNGPTYVLPDQSFNSQQNVYPLLEELNSKTLTKYRVSSNDSLSDWQKKIGNFCLNNSRLMFAVSLAFTGPILRFVQGVRSGGFQIYGAAETGKSTAAMVAGSVWGCHRQPDNGFLEGWNTTANAVEVTALAHNDGLLILDETRTQGNVTKRLEVVLEVTMRLAEQQEKNRLVGAKEYRSWRCYFLSTSNFSLDEMAAKAGGEVDDADRGRLVDIPLPKDAYGIYEDLHGFPSGSELTDRLKTLCRLYYGVPIREFISKLLTHLVRNKGSSELKDGVQKLHHQYLQKLKEEPGAAKALNRASSRFATVYAAGALAISLGVLDWNKSALGEAILRCQLDGLTKPKITAEDSAILATDRKLANYLRQHQAKSMDLRKKYADPRTHQFKAVPYYRAIYKGSQYWYLSGAALQSIIGVGAGARRYKQSLADRGRLDVSTGGESGRRFVVERRIFTGKGKEGMKWVHAIRTQPLKTSA